MNDKIKRQFKFLASHGNKDIRLAAEEWDKDWKILISTIMSARTRDEVTIVVAEKLFKKYQTPKKLGSAKIDEVKKVIRPVNFFNNKAKNVKNCAKALAEEYGGEVPKNIEKLVKLPGVGRKTANVFLSEVGDHAIGIDTHLSYISQKLNWTKNKSPDKIEKDLERLFPKRYWRKLNPVAVRFGKTHTSKREKDRLLESIK